MYMSYLGGDGMPVEAYDLLGISLAIISGVAAAARAGLSGGRSADAGAAHPAAVLPQARDLAVGARLCLLAPLEVDARALFALEIRSMIRGPALPGSYMEKYAMLSESADVDE